MRARVIGAVLGVLGFSACWVQASTISLNFSSLPGATVQFNGAASSFILNPAGGNQWWITSVNNGVGDSLTFQGRFTGGPWIYGPITVSGPNQQASVLNPSGGLTIFDGTGGSAAGNVSWVDVATFNFGGVINASATVNLTGLTYAPGTTPSSDLQAFVANGLGSALVTFQFNPGMTLTDLTTGTGPYRTSFSGSLAAVPEPGSMLLTLLALLPLLRTKRG